MAKRHSGNYVMTIDPLSAVDMEKYQIIKQTVKAANQSRTIKQRVVLRGRKPKVKKIMHNFWTGKCALRGYDWAGNIVGGIMNATKYDVYIYNRY